MPQREGSIPRRPFSRLLARRLPLLLVAVATGCRPADEIETYRIAKADEPSAPAAGASAMGAPAPRPAPTGDPTDRMIGSIVPGPTQAWFFKAVGPKSALDPAAESITTFLGSVRFDGDEPSWQAPEGWEAGPPKPMRLATLMVPVEGADPIELSVIGLPKVSGWDSQVLDNVNRWRKQLQLEPVSESDLDSETQPLGDVAEGAVLFDVDGWFDGGTMAPFANAPFAGAPFAGGATPAAPPTPPRQAPPSGAQPGGLQFETPEGWADEPGSAMRKVSLRSPEGAVLTGFAFPEAGAMGDRLDNVNRWRREIGLPPVTQEEIGATAEKIELLGAEGDYFELVGPEETTIAAMAARDGVVWFFKLRGPGEAADAGRETFRAWLQSLSL